MRRMETVAWDNCHHLLLQLQTNWEYLVMGDFYNHLDLWNWVSSESCQHLLLQVQTGWEFGVVGDFSTYYYSRIGAMTPSSLTVMLSILSKEHDLYYPLSL